MGDQDCVFVCGCFMKVKGDGGRGTCTPPSKYKYNYLSWILLLFHDDCIFLNYFSCAQAGCPCTGKTRHEINECQAMGSCPCIGSEINFRTSTRIQEACREWSNEPMKKIEEEKRGSSVMPKMMHKYLLKDIGG